MFYSNGMRPAIIPRPIILHGLVNFADDSLRSWDASKQFQILSVFFKKEGKEVGVYRLSCVDAALSNRSFFPSKPVKPQIVNFGATL
jgi:hypothetical protein